MERSITLGIVSDFIESALFPQVMVAGFPGLKPRLDGMVVQPQLPRDWPSLTITIAGGEGLLLPGPQENTLRPTPPPQ